MSSLASRLHGGDMLTLPEFAHDVVVWLAQQWPDLAVTQPRPEVIAVGAAGKPPIEFNLQSSYRSYQHDPRSKDEIIRRLLRWIETSVRR